MKNIIKEFYEKEKYLFEILAALFLITSFFLGVKTTQNIPGRSIEQIKFFFLLLSTICLIYILYKIVGLLIYEFTDSNKTLVTNNTLDTLKKQLESLYGQMFMIFFIYAIFLLVTIHFLIFLVSSYFLETLACGSFFVVFWIGRKISVYFSENPIVISLSNSKKITNFLAFLYFVVIIFILFLPVIFYVLVYLNNFSLAFISLLLILDFLFSSILIIYFSKKIK